MGLKGFGGAYAGKMDVDGAVGVDGGGFAAQGGDFAEDADGLVGEGLEVFGVDAGGGFGGHGRGEGVWGGGIGFGKEVGCGLGWFRGEFRERLESRLRRKNASSPSTPTHVTAKVKLFFFSSFLLFF